MILSSFEFGGTIVPPVESAFEWWTLQFSSSLSMRPPVIDGVRFLP